MIGRVGLTSLRMAERGMPAGHWLTVQIFSRASSVLDRPSISIRYAISSSSELNLAGAMGKGDRTSILYPVAESCRMPSAIVVSRSGEMISI